MIIFDLETGGLKEDAPIIQIAAIAIDAQGNEKEAFECKILFDESQAEKEALEINHYSREVWESLGVPPVNAVARLSHFLKTHASLHLISKAGNPYSVAELCSYNSAFDAPRLKRFYTGQFLPAHPRVLCALQRVMWYFKETRMPISNFKLSTVANFFGILSDGAHDALEDVRLTHKVLKEISTRYATLADIKNWHAGANNK